MHGWILRSELWTALLRLPFIKSKLQIPRGRRCYKLDAIFATKRNVTLLRCYKILSCCFSSWTSATWWKRITRHPRPTSRLYISRSRWIMSRSVRGFSEQSDCPPWCQETTSTPVGPACRAMVVQRALGAQSKRALQTETRVFIGQHNSGAVCACSVSGRGEQGERIWAELPGSPQNGAGRPDTLLYQKSHGVDSWCLPCPPVVLYTARTGAQWHRWQQLGTLQRIAILI